MSVINTVSSPLPSIAESNRSENIKPKKNGHFAEILKAEQKQKAKTELVKKVATDFVNFKKTNTIEDLDQNGTNIAIKELATDMERQFYSYMWNLAFSNSEGNYVEGIGEELFHRELVEEMVENSADEEMGEIAKEIYEEVIRIEGIEDARRTGNQGISKEF